MNNPDDAPINIVRGMVRDSILATLELLPRQALKEVLGEVVDALTRPEPAAPVVERWLTADEVAVKLGVTKYQVMALGRQGKLECRKFGRYPRFNLSAVAVAT